MVSRPRSRSILAVLLLTGLLVAGCGSPDEDQGDPAKTREWDVGLLGGGSGMAYFDGVEGPITVIAEELPSDSECPRHDTEVADVWYVEIFNRTGIAKYYRWPMAQPFNEKEFRHQLVLPPDPPYLIWGDGTCSSFTVRVQGVAERAGFVGEQGITDGTGGAPAFVAIEYVYVPHTVSVPLGQMRGEGAIHLDGVQYHIELPVLGGAVDWTPGAGGGTISTYEPIQVPDGVNWMAQVQRGALENEFRYRRPEMGMPGDYPLVLQLDAPAPPGAEWEARAWILRLEPSIADLGFDYPPKVWVDCHVQQCELSGPPTA